MKNKLTYDHVGSVRSTDEDGRLKIAKTNISKATVNPYYGREIPNHEELGLDSEKQYRLLRHPDELEKGIESFNNLPVLSDHTHVTAENPRKDLQIGSTGSEATFDKPFLTNSMHIWDGDAIKKINDGSQKEISCAYRYDPVMKPGTYDGKSYDGVMTNIRGNHVALVSKGRAGPDVLVADSNKGMKMDDINDLVPAIQGLCPDIGGDTIRAALSQLVADLNTKEAEGGEESVAPPEGITGDEGMDDKNCAKDAEPMTPEELKAMAEAMKKGGATDEQIAKCIQSCTPTASDEDEEEKKANEIEGGEKANETLEKERKEAEDEDDDGEEEKPKGAMDSATNKAIRAINARNRARAAVKPLVGNIVAMDSASSAEIYRYALKQKGKKVKDINCRGLRQMALMAADSAVNRRTKLASDAAPVSIDTEAVMAAYCGK